MADTLASLEGMCRGRRSTTRSAACASSSRRRYSQRVRSQVSGPRSWSGNGTWDLRLTAHDLENHRNSLSMNILYLASFIGGLLLAVRIMIAGVERSRDEHPEGERSFRL